jgi:hypothetical protein
MDARPNPKLILVTAVVILAAFAAQAGAALQSGVPFYTSLSGLTIANTDIVVPEGARRLTVSLSDGSGDLDLYLKYGSPVSGSTISEIDADADIRSDGPGADESITITPSSRPALRPGTWYVATLNLNQETTHFTLTATIEVDSPPNIDHGDAVDFGSVTVGQTAQKFIEVSNSGTASLVISSVDISGADAPMFGETHNCTTVGPSETCTITVTFSPISPGSKAAQLNVYSNDPDTPALVIPLTGAGVADVPGQTLPLPAGESIYAPYPPVVTAGTGVDPSEAKPIGVGSVAVQGDTVDIEVKLERPAGPYDAYFALHAPVIDPNELFMLGPDGNFHALSQNGLVKWKQSASEGIDEDLFGAFSVSSLPGGTYSLYLMVTAAGSFDPYYLWHTYFTAPGTSGNVPDGSVDFFNGSLVVPNATIIYQGVSFEGSAPLAEDGIAAIMKDGKTYLYHPALGRAELSDYNSRRAVGYFMAGVSASEVEAMRAARAVSTRTTTAKVVGVGQTVRLGTGVDIELLDSNGMTRAVNKGRRWAVVKTGQSNSLKYFLVPRSNVVPTEILDQVMGVGQVVIGDLDGAISSLNTERSDIEAFSEIETFGAFVRMAPVFAARGGWGENQLEALEKDRDLTVLVNSVDLFYSTLEFFKNIAGLIPFECADAFISSGLFRYLQSKMVQYMTADLNAEFQLDTAMVKSIVSSSIGCAGDLLTVSAAEAFNSWCDVISLLNWVIEDVVFENYLAYTGGYLDAYDLAFIGTGMMAYTYPDLSLGTVKEVVQNMEDGSSWEVAGTPGVFRQTVAMSPGGVVVSFWETDPEKIIATTDWGRGAQTDIGAACGLCEDRYLSPQRIAIDDSGRLFFMGSKCWEEDTNYGGTRMVYQDGIYTALPDGTDCRYVPIDLDPQEGNGVDSIHVDGLSVSGDAQKLVFSLSADYGSTYHLYSIHPSGVGLRLLASSEGEISTVEVSDFGDRVAFEYNPDFDTVLGSVSPDGGAVVNLTAASGLELYPEYACISPDGNWVVTIGVDMTHPQNPLRLALIKSDGSEARWLDTGNITPVYNHIDFTLDGRSVAFVGADTTVPADRRYSDIFAVDIDVDQPNLRNLTNTDTISEQFLILR